MATAKSSSKIKQAADAKPASAAPSPVPVPVTKKKPASVDAPKTVVAKKAKAKTTVTAKKAVTAQPATVVTAAKPIKDKLVRDSFTMPRSDFALIDQLKEKALGFKRPTKKSELLRAGLHVLASLSDAKLKTALGALVPLKLGRPPREGQ